MATNLNSAIQQVAGTLEKMQREKPTGLNEMFKSIMDPIRDAFIASRDEIDALKREIEELKAKTTRTNAQNR